MALPIILSTSSSAATENAAAKLAVVIAFSLGFVIGYKSKEWRIRWTRFRRDRLAKKLAETQKTLDSL